MTPKNYLPMHPPVQTPGVAEAASAAAVQDQTKKSYKIWAVVLFVQLVPMGLMMIWVALNFLIRALGS